MFKSMQAVCWRRFWVFIAVICAHSVFFYVLRNGLQHEEMPAVSREIMVALISSAPAPASDPIPQPAPKQVSNTIVKIKAVSKAAPAPAPAPIPVVTAAPSVMPVHPVAAASEVAAPAPVQPVSASPVIATAVASPVQPKTISSGVEYLKKPSPVYPSFSKRMHEEGKVILRVLVNVKGKPEQVDVQKSSGFPRLDEAGRQAVLSAVFKPYSENGQALVVFVLVPINFQLDN